MSREELQPQNLFRPVKPNWDVLQMEMQLKATGANVHKLKGNFHAVKHAWELGEDIVGWEEKTKVFFEKALEQFNASLRS